MKPRKNHRSQGLIFVAVCVLVAAVLFLAIRLGRVPARADGLGNEAAAVENTYQPDIDAVESGSPDGAALPPTEIGEVGAVAEGPPAKVAQSADESTINGSDMTLAGLPIACRGEWTDGVSNGIRIDLNLGEDALGSYRWHFENVLAAEGRFKAAEIPTVLQVDEYTYEMTCTDIEAKVVPTGEGANRWDEWKMYRVR